MSYYDKELFLKTSVYLFINFINDIHFVFSVGCFVTFHLSQFLYSIIPYLDIFLYICVVAGGSAW